MYQSIYLISLQTCTHINQIKVYLSIQEQRHLILEVNLGALTQILTIRLSLFGLVLKGFHVISYEFHHLLIPEVTLCQLYAAACHFCFFEYVVMHFNIWNCTRLK